MRGSRKRGLLRGHLQSVTTILDEESRELNCSADVINKGSAMFEWL